MAIEKRVRLGLAGICMLWLAALSCKRPPPFNYAERVGWLHGPCLAIANSNLGPATPLTLVLTGEPQRIQQAKIVGQTTSSETCPALLEGRAKVNAADGIVFFALESSGLTPRQMGFGIVSPPTPLEIRNNQAQSDLNQDGHAELYTTCNTTEGIKFSIWNEKAYQGKPLWTAYNFLDYEMTPSCPE